MVEKEDILDLREVFETIKKRIVLILSITFIATILSGVVSYYFITPIYQATALLLVSKEENNTINNAEVQANINLVNTYREIIKNQTILDKVGSQLGFSEAQTAQLGNSIKVNSVKNSQVISITVENSSQKQAALIANTLANTFKTEIVQLMSINNVQVLSLAKEKPNATPVSPKIPFVLIITFVVSLIVGIAIAFLLDNLDNTLKTENDIEKELALPVLGAVPQINEGKKKTKNRKMRPYEVTSPRERRA